MSKKRELQFRTFGGEIVGRPVDVTGYSEHNVEKTILGMMRNMRDDLYVYDTELDDDSGEE
jgi:hypothetical protein